MDDLHSNSQTKSECSIGKSNSELTSAAAASLPPSNLDESLTTFSTPSLSNLPPVVGEDSEDSEKDQNGFQKEGKKDDARALNKSLPMTTTDLSGRHNNHKNVEQLCGRASGDARSLSACPSEWESRCTSLATVSSGSPSNTGMGVSLLQIILLINS